MEDKIQAYRQPLVTATGIILGFILNFASLFVKTETSVHTFISYLIAICILTGIVLLITVLYRILNMQYPKQSPEIYYRKTLLYFIIGVSVSFFGVMMDMFTHFMTD